jgi:hypothetical protein
MDAIFVIRSFVFNTLSVSLVGSPFLLQLVRLVFAFGEVLFFAFLEIGSHSVNGSE